MDKNPNVHNYLWKKPVENINEVNETNNKEDKQNEI